MKDFQTIIGVIELKSQGESLGTIQRRYGIGHSTVERILDRRFELRLKRKINSNMVEQLQMCQWIDEGRNLLITGATGTGKTYIANALAMCALQKFKTVRYLRADTCIKECEAANINGTELDYENSLASLDLLVIDDFGLMELDVRKSRALLNIIESRDSRKSTIISSQFPVEKWYGFFKDSTYADSLMDRILTKAFKLELSGPSLRN